MKKWRSRLLSFVLSLMMVLTLLPSTAFATTTTTASDTTVTNVAKVQSYAAQLRDANDASKTGGKFTWDTEGKAYSWTYFNGLMLDAFNMIGGSDNTSYADTFYNANIGTDGAWVSSATYGALDSVEPIRAVFDILATSSNKIKYQAGIQYVYTMLENKTSYSECGGNFKHLESENSYEIMLDGVYMAEPFLMECANAIDAGNLTLKSGTNGNGAAVSSSDIYDAVFNRFAWIYDTMYDSSTGLYYHAYDPDTKKTNGVFWSRSIGWYAMALVDTIGMMPEGTNKTTLISYLPRLFDGLLKWQDSDTGMWYNVPNYDSSLTNGTRNNELETSGTSMFAYAMMKAYNNGWVTDSKYAEAGLKAFNGVVANKMTGSEGNYSVSGTYLKSGVLTTATGYLSYDYTTNEAKGVGALIMASTLANDTVAKLAAGSSSGESQGSTTEDTTTTEVKDEATNIVVSGSGATKLTVVDVTNTDTVTNAVSSLLDDGYVAYDFTLTGYTEGTKATVKFPIPSTVTDKSRFVVYYVPESGAAEKMDGAVDADGEYYVFTTTHFSTYVGGLLTSAEDTADGDTTSSVSASGNLATETSTSTETTTYVLASSIDTNSEYLIASGKSGSVSILGHSGTTATSASGTVSGTTLTLSDDDFDDTSYLWKFSGTSSGTVSNNGIYIYLGSYDFLSTDSRTLSISMSSFAATISYKSMGLTRYLRYSNGWGSKNSTSTSVYLYKKSSTTTYPTTMEKGDSVTLSVTPSSATLNAYNEEYTTLTPSVTVGDSATAAKSSTITWSSDNTSVATVDQSGNVTSVAKGTANITATLSKVNGSSIYKDSSSTGTITVTIPITVNYVEKITPLPDYTYDSSLVPATSYPEYPNDGAVRINKSATGYDFTTTGVANVELDAAGISVKKGVDVVLIVDVSNSMGWSIENSGNSSDSDKRPSTGQTTKLQDAMDAASEFAELLLGDNTNSSSDNTLSFVTFAGYDKENGAAQDNIDSVMTVFTGVKDVDKAKTSFSGTSFSGTGTTYTLKITDENGNELVNGSNRGDTNYDYAFWQGKKCVDALQSSYVNDTYKTYADTGRETIVLFMTDGAASHYNGMKAKSTRTDYKPGTTEPYSYYTGTTTITQDQWLNYMKITDNTYANELYKEVDGFYAIGFDLSHGGFSTFVWGESDLTSVLSGMVTDATIPVMTASTSTALNGLYEKLGNQIKLAGTKAQVTDTIKSDYTLQMGSTAGTGTNAQSGIPSDITVKTYDLYSKTDTSESTLIGTRKGTSSTLETVTFNPDGTEAYSDILGTDTNIMSTTDGVLKIDAYYFTYTNSNGTEKFVWKIGNITDKEVALNYYVYLKGALEGDVKQGVYDTNESAVLDYIDINGYKAQKTYPVPALAWGGASTAYEFYLVNANGDPVNHAGTVVPFANRVIVAGPTYKILNINQSASVEAATVKASEVLPEGYYLYDENASYTVTTSGGNLLTGQLTISDPSSDASSEKGGQTQSGAQTTKVVSFDEKNFTQSTVAFGIRYDMTPTYVDDAMTKNQVVIDYGKSIDVDVLANDLTVITSNSGNTKYDGYTRSLVGFAAYNASANMKQVQESAGTGTFATDNGLYQIVDGKVRFTPTKMLSTVDKVFCVVKFATSSDAIYLYEELDIIPATVMYYETDFSDVITVDMSQVTDKSEAADGVQDDGTIGKNTYGYDSSYLDDNLLSNGSSYFTNYNVYSDTDSSNDTAIILSNVAGFSFTGTGFDLISRTGTTQGIIRARIYSDAAKDTKVKTVTVSNQSESSLELYQIPVISVNDLPYGTYYVTIDVYTAYTDKDYPSLNRGGEFYFDALRIYDPIDVSAGSACTGDTAIAYNAYVADGENAEIFTELRGKLLSSDKAAEVLGTTDDDGKSVEGVLYVDRTQDGVKLSSYSSIGPNNEVYLTDTSTDDNDDGAQAIAFALDISDKNLSSIDIGAKSANGEDAKLHITVYDADGENALAETTETLKSSTVEFYDIFGETSIANIKNSNSSIYVTIDTNRDPGILSLTDLKVAYGDTPSNTSLTTTATSSLAKAVMSLYAAEEETVPEVNCDVVSASFTSTKVVRNKKATMTVVTGSDAESLKVLNSAGKAQNITVSSVANDDGTKTWTVIFKVTATGTQTYTVTGYDADGNAGAAATASIKVTLR